MPRNWARSRLQLLVEQFYDCVADDSQWQPALRTLCDACGGVIGLVAVADTAARSARFTAAYGDPATLAPLLEQGAPELPFYAGLSSMELDVPVTVDMLYDIQGPGTRRTWLESPMNTQWAVPNGLDDFFWVALMKQPARIGSLIVITPRDRARITPEELRDFAELAPHVRRAITIGDIIETERNTASLFRSVVDALAHPVVIVTEGMRILHANPAAEALFSVGVPISANGGRLSIAWSYAESAVDAAVRIGARDECALGTSGISVPLSKVRKPAVAHVLPLARRDRSARIANGAVAAIFIAQAGAVPVAAVEAVAALFGLTAAEKRVTGQIADGLARHEIAEANAVSDGTVKSQLAAIFDKTGARDQRELQHLVHDLTPPTAKH